MKTKISILCLLLWTAKAYSQTRFPIIPFPNKMVEGKGNFEFKTQLSVSLPVVFKPEIGILKSLFQEDFIQLIPSEKGKVVVKLNQKIANEGYTLDVNPDRITIQAATTTGCFYAFQTIRQLMKMDGLGNYTIPTCQIEDEPAFSWRAYMLDDAKNFQGKEVVEKILDQMALLKMNVFHWHLTEDSGWRIAIDKYPLLTQVGAWRDSTLLIGWKPDPKTGELKRQNAGWDTELRGGFYTKNDIREIVLYASKRHIQIVPEIDMPGHSIAAIAAYPWLSASGKQIKVSSKNIGVTDVALNIADEKVYEFIENVLGEVVELFPSKIIHIGGDEVKFDSWKNRKDVNEIMAKNNLKNFSDLHIYFSNRISKYLKSKGCRMMGWNEILGNIHEDKSEAKANLVLDHHTIIDYWRGDTLLYKQAIEQGYDVVYNKGSDTYLSLPIEVLTLSKSYHFSPIPKGISVDQKKQVLGLSVSMWGAITPKALDVYQFTFPRIAAFAEVAWTREESKNYARFTEGVAKLKRHWDRKGIYYYEGTK
jgi:hexosaminidase